MGSSLRDIGHKRLPEPPHRITGTMDEAMAVAEWEPPLFYDDLRAGRDNRRRCAFPSPATRGFIGSQLCPALAGLDAVAALLIVSNAGHRFLVPEQLRDVCIKPHTHILERRGAIRRPAPRFSWRVCAEKTLVVCRQSLAFHGKA